MQTPFNSIKKINEHGQEFWTARTLMSLLGYKEWRKFQGAIKKAEQSCIQNNQQLENHIVAAADMVLIGSGATREISDYHLSRYACYLIAQNGDPRKPEIANAQNYFAIQTRKQEVSENLLEDKKRVLLREDIKQHNVDLAKAADEAGVQKYGVFQNFGYMGLYGGLKAKDIHKKKGLKKSQKILDHMTSEELAANLFRATQAEAKLKREKIQGANNANKAHFEVGQTVRKTIEELGGTMPEELPTTDGIKQAKTRLKNSENDLLS